MSGCGGGMLGGVGTKNRADGRSGGDGRLGSLSGPSNSLVCQEPAAPMTVGALALVLLLFVFPC